MVLRLVTASLAARRARIALAFTAVTLGVAVATALATLALQVGDDLARTLRAAGPNFVVLPAGARLSLDLGGADVVPPRAGLALPDTSVAGLKRAFWKNNVLEAAPELAAPATVGGARARLVGTWFDRAVATDDGPWRTGLPQLHPTWQVRGRWPREGAAEIALGRDLAARLSLGPGRAVEVSAGGSRARFRVAGVVTAGGFDDRLAWAPLAGVQALTARPGQVDRIWLSALVIPEPKQAPPDPAKDPHGYEIYMCTAYPGVVARDIAERFPGAEVLPATEVVAGEGRVVGRLNLLMLLLALAALAASTLGLFSTTTATVVERGVELGLLRALGATATQIAALLLGETLLVSLAGGLAGWLAGSLGAAAIRGQTFGAGAPLQPLLLPLALALAAGVALLGTLGPLRLALRLDPAQVLRG
ncbi:MAG: ABC transporter permease [Candidatus Eisenbacteria bacterium]|nr:ABC transporter permease [Candidatus Eisenbacteria bacterium]